MSTKTKEIFKQFRDKNCNDFYIALTHLSPQSEFHHPLSSLIFKHSHKVMLHFRNAKKKKIKSDLCHSFFSKSKFVLWPCQKANVQAVYVSAYMSLLRENK